MAIASALRIGTVVVCPPPVEPSPEVVVSVTV
jgi:hypothetical protein